MRIAMLSVVVNIIGSLVLSQFFAHVGIAMATAIAAWVKTAGLGLVGRPGPAQAQEAPAPVAFARSELTVPDGGAASLTLFNNTTAELLLTARVSPADESAVAAAARTVTSSELTWSGRPASLRTSRRINTSASRSE